MDSSRSRAADETFVRAALREAQLAYDAGEVPVGAVVVAAATARSGADERIVSYGHNRIVRDNDPTAHAEVIALRNAALALGNYRLEGCTLYSTLEPCSMCAGAMIHSRIARLVYGAADPKAGANGSVLNVLNHPRLNHRIEVDTGILAEDCGEILRSFFRARRSSPLNG